jgi:hypothetical protein
VCFTVLATSPPSWRKNLAHMPTPSRTMSQTIRNRVGMSSVRPNPPLERRRQRARVALLGSNGPKRAGTSKRVVRSFRRHFSMKSA